MPHHARPANRNPLVTAHTRAGRASPQGFKRTVLACAIGYACATGLAAVTFPGSALAADAPAAQTQRKAYAIPAGPLEAALNRFGREAGVLLSFPTETTAGRQSPGLRGNYAVQEALSLLLQGTGLAAVVQANGSYALVAVARREEDPNAPTTLPTVTVSAERDDNLVVEGYKADDATTATRSALPIQETPSSIGVVTSDYIRDSFARSQNDAFEQVSGVTRRESRFSRGEGFNIRGFTTGLFFGTFSGLKANGLATDGIFAPDPAIIERYEILKGPASITGGASSPGGVVNRITKKPLNENFTNFEATAGSFDFYRSVVDVNSVLPQNEDLRGRLIVAYEEGGNHVDDVDSRQYIIAPSAEIDLFDGAGTLLLTGHYQNFDGTTYLGLPLLSNGKVPDVPVRRNAAGTDNTETTFRGGNTELHYDHEFVDNLKLSIKTKYAESDLPSRSLYAYQFGGADLNGDTNIYAGLRENEFETFAGEIFLSKQFEAWGQEQELTVGADFRDQSQIFSTSYSYPALGVVNLFDPQTNFIAPSDDELRANNLTRRETELQQTGVFVQAVVRPTDRLTLVGGGRYDSVDASNADLVDGGSQEADPSEFTGRLGAVFKISPWMNVYGGYSESFEQNAFATTSTNTLLPPETGQQYEIGAKFDLLDGRLGITTALYNAYRQNAAAPDPDDRFSSIAVGEQRHQGFELDINGELMPGLKIATNFSVIDAEITDDTREIDEPGVEGSTPVQVPEYSGRVLLTYELQSGPLQGFAFGGGVYFVGDSEIEEPNRFKIDGYERVDLVASYRLNDDIDFAFNVRNLLDETYIETPGRVNAYNTFGAPLSVFATARFKF